MIELLFLLSLVLNIWQSRCQTFHPAIYSW